MKLKIDHFVPFIVIGALICLFVFNNKTPTLSPDGNVIIKPEHKLEVFRTLAKEDDIENDNHYTITHVESGDKLNLLEYNGYLMLPDGENKLPTKKNAEGKDVPIFKVQHIKKDWIFDPTFDIGCYTGFVDGNFQNEKSKNFDVGVRLSPLKIYNTFALDILVSNQDAGIGISYFPLPIRYGRFFEHLGVGYGKVLIYEDKSYQNLFYLGFSTKF